MIRLLVYVFLVSMGFISLAYGDDSGVSMMSKESCKPDLVIVLLLEESQDVSKLHARNLLSTINKIENIKSTIKDNKKLSVEDTVKLKTLEQELKTNEQRLVVESRYQRDLQTIENFIEASATYDKSGNMPANLGEKEFYFKILTAWQNLGVSQDITETTSQVCTLDYAIYDLEKAHITQTTAAGVTVDPRFITNMENIRRYFKISELIRNISMQDELYKEGEIENADMPINALIKKIPMSPEDKKMLDYWKIINEQIPSRMVESLRKIHDSKHKPPVVAPSVSSP